MERNGLVRKLAAYVMLGINYEGRKEIIGLSIGENESAKYWLGVLNELKNRGVRDIMVICADGLTGIKEAIASAKHVYYKDMKAFTADLKTIYLAESEKAGSAGRSGQSEYFC